MGAGSAGRCETHPGPGRAESATVARRSARWSASRPMVRTSTCHALPIGNEASSWPCARSQRITPRSVTTANTRPSRRIAGARIHVDGWLARATSGIRGRVRPGTGSSRPPPDHDPSVLAEPGQRAAGQAQDGPAEDRVPEPEPSVPAIAGQQGAGGVEGRVQAAVRALEGRLRGCPSWRPRDRSGIVARSRHRARHRGSTRPSPASRERDRSDEPARFHLDKLATRCLRSVDDRDLGTIRTEGHVLRRPGPRRRLRGRPVASSYMMISPSAWATAIRRLSGLNRPSAP